MTEVREVPKTEVVQAMVAGHPSFVKREAVQAIPTIDLSPFLTNGNEIARRKVADALRKACIDVGFFYLIGHDLPENELNEAIVQSHRFFSLPLTTKSQYRATGKGENGFVQVGGLAAQSASTADLKERFIMARATSRGDQASHWPADDVLPGFTSFMKAHIEKRTRLARSLAKAFALSLKLPEGHFDEYYREMGYNVLINYYPPITPDDLKTSKWSFSPHTDYGSFTLLSQDSLGGLQVRNSAGTWIDVPPIENAFVVNLGDLMSMWTNDLYASTLHRALNVANVARISIPFFVSPNPNAVIETLPTCEDADHPSQYPPVKAGEHLRKLIEQADQTGQAGISENTATRLKQG